MSLRIVALSILVLACGQTPDSRPKPVKPEAAAVRTKAAVQMQQPAQPLSVGNGVTAPSVITRVEAEFPPLQKGQRVGGAIILETIISAAGEVESVRIVSDPEIAGATEAAAAVRKWRFRPGTFHGKPVRVRVGMTVNIHWS